MKILITIPHAFLAQPLTGLHASERGDAAGRAAVLLRCVTALHQAFGAEHRLLGPDDPACNTDQTHLVIALCVTGDQHLADTLPPGLVHVCHMDVHPRSLGFACHAVLRNNAAQFDWCGYLEDDLEVTDALFLDKLAWFSATFGPDVMLLPNRFEVSAGPVPKLYIDGALRNEALAEPFQDITINPRLTAAPLGRMMQFDRVANPHAGCFFASAAQMARIAAHPEFGTYTEAFNGPLESAATLPPLRSFNVYKPARDNADFLEVRHLDQQHLDRVVRYSRDGNFLRKSVSEPEHDQHPA